MLHHGEHLINEYINNCNGDFICLALVVPTLGLTVVSVGRVAGFPTTIPNIHYSWSEQRPHVTSSKASNKRRRKLNYILAY